MANEVKVVKKKPGKYNMPAPIPKGTLLTDIGKKQWRIGPSIGKGGFGEIYSAQEASQTGAKCPFVIKIEPHENGPLFVEMHFYMKCSKQADIDEFKAAHNLKQLGMPMYVGSGSEEVGGVKYRFLVMEQFGSDIERVRAENGGLSRVAVFQLAWQIVYVLEYIHEMGYVHADIKGANVLLGTGRDDKSQAYLVDFGLAAKFVTGNVYKKNPKKAHDGTIEYVSRDAHDGVPTRRGDLEILAYNLVQWLGGRLPWSSNLKEPLEVQKKKNEAFADLSQFIDDCFTASPPKALIHYMEYVKSLEFNTAPNYEKIRLIFEKEIKENGGKVGVLSLNSSSKRKSPTVVQNGEVAAKKNKKIKAPGKKIVMQVENGEEILTPAARAILEKKMEKANGKTVKKNGEVKNDLDLNRPSSSASSVSTTSENGEIQRLKDKIGAKNITKRKPSTIVEDDIPLVQRRGRQNLRVVNYKE